MQRIISALARPDLSKNNPDRTLVLFILGTCLAGTLFLSFSNASPQIMLLLSVFLFLSILLTLRGYVLLASMLAPLVGYTIVAHLIFQNYGIRDSAMLGLPAIIIAASLMNGRYGTLAFGALSLLLVIVHGMTEVAGMSTNHTALPSTPADYAVVICVIILTVILQMAVLGRLRDSAQRLRRELIDRQQAEAAARLSEERYRLISEISSDYVFSSEVKPDGAMITHWVGGAFELISGYSLDEFKARGGWPSTLHPDDIDIDQKGLDVLHSNHKATIEVRVIAKDGAIRWVRVFARPIWDAEENRLTGIYGAVQNITEQKIIENELRESDERYRTFIAQSTEGIRCYDLTEPIPLHLSEDEQVRKMITNMYIAECNDAFAHMYGLESSSQLVGKKLEDMHLQDDPANISGLYDFIRSGYHIKDSISHEIDAQGQEHYFLVNTIGILENGCLMRAWGVQTDITERKHAEDKINQLNEQLEERVVERTAQLEAANKELEAFSYSVSHDLRAPLRSINGFGEILIRDFGEQLDEQAQSFLKRIIASSNDMSELVDSLLEFSRLGRNKLSKVTVNLSDLAITILENLERNEPERKVHWQVTPGLQVQADETLIRNMLENLLSNAWKYTSKMPQAEISFCAQPTEGPTIYFVKDNGAGFDMQYANKLFGTFQRLHRSDEFPGHGIGLANVQRIIHRHGGKVWAHGEPGLGATFYFTLPNK